MMTSDAGRLGTHARAVVPSVERSTPVAEWRAPTLLGLGLAVAYLLAVGVEQPTYIIALVGLSAAVSIVSPVTGLAMFAVIMPMQEPELLVPLRPDAIFAAAIALGCILRAPRDRFAITLHPGLILLIGFLALSGISLLPGVSGHPSDWTPSAANELLHVGTGVALFLAASYLFRLVPIGPILVLALVGAALAALLALGDFFRDPPFAELYRGLLSKNLSLRVSGGFSDANYLGLFVAPTAVFAMGMVVVAPARWRIAVAAVAALLLAAVVVSFSREAYISVAVGVVILLAGRDIKLAVIGAAVFGILALTLYPMFLEARLGTALSARDQLALIAGEQSRRDVAHAAFEMFLHQPIFGVGFGFFHFISPLYSGAGAALGTYSHNEALSIIGEQGIVGVLMVAGLVLMLVRTIWRSRSPLRWAALAMGAAYLVVSLFINSLTSFQGSCLVWLVMAATLAPAKVVRNSEA